MIRNEILLKPRIQLLKIFFFPILAFITFSLFVFLTGYRGRTHPSKTPVVIEIGLPWYWIITLIVIFVLFIFILIKLGIANEINNDSKLTLIKSMLKIENSDYLMNFNLNKAEKFNIKVSKVWSKIFLLSYYRIGIIKIKYENDFYSFFFPVRNYEIELYIKKIQKKYREKHQ